MDYNIVNFENFYGGGVSSLSPEYGNFTGYRMGAAELGFPGSPQTANQLGEAVNAMKQGVKSFEVTMLQGDTAEMIPIQHFKEMRALMKLSGVKPSIHGPMIDAAGFDEKGNWGKEIGREDNERRMFDTLEKAYELGPEGNIPVVFHSAGPATPGAQMRPGKKKWGEKEDEIMERGAMVNVETGQVQGMKREYKFRPEAPEYLEEGRGKDAPPGILFSAEATVSSANLGDWESSLTEIAQMNKHAEELIGAAPMNLGGYENAVETKDGFYDLKTKEKLPDLDSDTGQQQSYNQMHKAGLFLENAELSFNGAFHKAYKYGSDKQKKELKELSENYAKSLKGTYGMVWEPVLRQQILDKTVVKLGEITANKAKIVNGEYVRDKHGRKVRDEDWGTPQVYQEINEFARDKAAETFANLAKRSYDELGGDKSPMIAIEPFHPGAALSGTEDMIKLTKKARENFAKQLMDEENFSKAKAKQIAEKKIGVTWDVGHINMIKKYGFTDKDVVKQTKKIAPMVKHVHLTDNFGFGDSHLAPGMGNVPMKKILEELEKTGRFKEMRKIVEAGAFVQHFKKSPHPLTMAAFGSPLYSMDGGAMGWNRAMDVQGAYFGGYGTTNPSTHHQYFGAGFTTMPVELGGQQANTNSRFGGTPMA